MNISDISLIIILFVLFVLILAIASLSRGMCGGMDVPLIPPSKNRKEGK